MPWIKGQSGNPKGKKAKSALERGIELEAKRHSPLAIATLVRNLNCGVPAAEVSAARDLLDRAFGKPGPMHEDKEIPTQIVRVEFVPVTRDELPPLPAIAYLPAGANE